jgi:hypothetical protein
MRGPTPGTALVDWNSGSNTNGRALTGVTVFA